ncbi:MAG: four helix bundle protein [Opitutaceae bacterium]|jgi:four helix bundle protein|nr:four helix bundle protein [Opitutaceae bacterium]
MFNADGDLRKRTKAFAHRVADAYESLPKGKRLAQVWGDQMLRAGGSVGANYREAQRGRTQAEYVSKLGDCLREADEALYWMELLEERKYFSTKRIAPLQKEANELIAIFITLIRKGRGR